MAGSFKDAWENEILDHALGVSTSTFNATVYVALYTVVPSDSAQGTEVTNANAYARTAVTFSAASGGATSNSAQVTFPTATGSWGTVVGMTVNEANTHGVDDGVMWSDVTSQAIGNGQTAVFLTGDIDATLT